jgi:hypothetical protein
MPAVAEQTVISKAPLHLRVQAIREHTSGLTKVLGLLAQVHHLLELEGKVAGNLDLTVRGRKAFTASTEAKAFQGFAGDIKNLGIRIKGQRDRMNNFARDKEELEAEDD